MSTEVTTPRIVCPAWCVVDVSEHLADLEGWEGCCIHRSKTVTTPGVDGGELEVRLSYETRADGTPDQAPFIFIEGVLLTLEDAERHVQQVQAAVETGAHLITTTTEPPRLLDRGGSCVFA